MQHVAEKSQYANRYTSKTKYNKSNVHVNRTNSAIYTMNNTFKLRVAMLSLYQLVHNYFVVSIVVDDKRYSRMCIHSLSLSMKGRPINRAVSELSLRLY